MKQEVTMKIRIGSATVELAVTLPVLVLFFFSTVEISSRMHLKQTATSTAYEAARRVTAIGGGDSDGKAVANSVLSARNISNAEVTFLPGSFDCIRGTEVTVVVEIPFENNLPFGTLFSGSSVKSSVTFIKQ